MKLSKSTANLLGFHAEKETLEVIKVNIREETMSASIQVIIDVFSS